MRADRRDGDLILARRSDSDEYDWIHDLARQLGLELDRSQYREELDTTLKMLLRETNDLLRGDLPQTPDDCRPLAQFATKDLHEPLVLFDMVLVGPADWQKRKLHADTTVGGLSGKLKTILEAELARELARMFTQWREWRVWELRKRRDEALETMYEEQRAERAEAERIRKANLPIPPPPGVRMQRTAEDMDPKGPFNYRPP